MKAVAGKGRDKFEAGWQLPACLKGSLPRLPTRNYYLCPAGKPAGAAQVGGKGSGQGSDDISLTER